MKRFFKPGRFLSAPMAGITDRSFRKVLRLFFDGLVFTEMVSVMALKYNFDKEKRLLLFDDMERPIGVQIFGKDPEAFFNASQKIRNFMPDVLDINMGCPARKVVSSGSGSALLKDRQLSKEIVDSVTDGFEGPVSIKIRLLDEFDIDKTLEFIDFVKNDSVSFVTVHLRTPADKFNKVINYALYKDLYDYRGIKIVINGGIDSQESADRIFNMGAGSLMIGHGMLGRPHIFQILNGLDKISIDKNILSSLLKYLDRSISAYFDNMDLDVSFIPLLHFALMKAEKGSIGIKEFRKHFCWYSKGIKNARELRTEIFKTFNAETIIGILKRMAWNE